MKKYFSEFINEKIIGTESKGIDEPGMWDYHGPMFDFIDNSQIVKYFRTGYNDKYDTIEQIFFDKNENVIYRVIFYDDFKMNSMGEVYVMFKLGGVWKTRRVKDIRKTFELLKELDKMYI